MAKNRSNEYKWKYSSIGGVVRVNITSGKDIASLGQLDQKLWTVLSCPATGLEFNQKTLSLLDSDNDGKIRAAEVIAASKWITSVLKNPDLLLKGDDVLPLDAINTENPEGAALYKSAKQILANLGKADADSISLADTSDSVAIFAGTTLNGDGIITEASVTDPAQQKAIASCVATVGSATDRSGKPGVDAALLDQFYAALADYSEWKGQAAANEASIFPYGADTAAAYAAYCALKDKVADYFVRCSLIGFDPATAPAVDLSVEKISAIRDLNLSSCPEQIAECPLARPAAEGLLKLDAINPAWAAAFAGFKALVIDKVYPGAKTVDQTQWNAIGESFGAYAAWCTAKKGAAVEGLGDETVAELLKDNCKDALLEVIAADLALKAESESIDLVNKLLHLYKYLYSFLNNYVTMRDFYNPNVRAVFEIGKLYVDQRCCNLCFKVEDMGKHADMASQSGMFLIYCTCTSKVKNATMNIVAALTDGKDGGIRVGTNAIFYDRDGQDWDAVVTKVVDNPISVKQAFWAPYRKFAAFIGEKVNKMVADKDGKLLAEAQQKVDTASADSIKDKPAPFDIAKFAGIFAAIGMALGFIGQALASLAKGVHSMPLWQTLLGVCAIILLISGPSCFIAWTKIRKRNIGPVLNANGWAINSVVLVNQLFGKTLTSVAKYPVVRNADPFAKRGMPVWTRWVLGLIIFAAAAFVGMYFADVLWWIGL